MLSTIQTQLRTRGELVLSGQLALAIRDYRFPMPVQLETERFIVRTQGEGLAILALFRQALLLRRVHALHPTVTAVDLPRGGRFRVWVDWEEVAVPAEGTRNSSAIYYCRMAPGGMQTEMIQYTRQLMPELNPQFAAIALSA